MRIILPITILVLLLPALSHSEQIDRDRSGSAIYTKQIIGGQIIYRDRTGSVIGTENLYGKRKSDPRTRVKAPQVD
ncbi:MAG: hypothetical protein ACLPVO_13035 [Desulfomonilaceae bacterium]